MEMIANAISGLSKDTIAAGFVRIASDVLSTPEDIDNFLEQLNKIENKMGSLKSNA